MENIIIIYKVEDTKNVGKNYFYYDLDVKDQGIVVKDNVKVGDVHIDGSIIKVNEVDYLLDLYNGVENLVKNENFYKEVTSNNRNVDFGVLENSHLDNRKKVIM